MSTTLLNLDDLHNQMMVFLPPVDMTSLCCCCIIDPTLAPDEHLVDCEIQAIQALKPGITDVLRSDPSCSVDVFTSNSTSSYTPSGGKSSSPSSSSATETATSTPTSDHDTEKRRKHRESMARLRRGWRTSIAALQQQEKELQELLRRMITQPTPPCEGHHTMDETDPLVSLRRAYRELVEEQVCLEQEHASLEAGMAHRNKYERLLERELVRVRMFHVGDSSD